MFLTGEFSKIARVSKRLLQYYDRIGLLTPAKTDIQTGFRYYSAQQLPRLNRILALKELGLSLDQIARFLDDDVSDEEIRGMLLMQQATLEKQIAEDLQRFHRVQTRLQQNQIEADVPDVLIKAIPTQSFLSVRTVFSNPEELMTLVEQLLHDVPRKVKSDTLGAFVGVFHSDDFNLRDNDVDLGYFLKKPLREPLALSEGCVLYSHELPAVDTMATSVQVGVNDPVLLGLGHVARWVEENGYHIVGAYREIGFNVNSLSDFDNAVIEVQVPVVKTELSSRLKNNFPD